MTHPFVSQSIWPLTLSDAEQNEYCTAGSQPIDRECDILVIGAGLVGCAIAYFTALTGQRVQLVDRSGLAAAASTANFGGVWPNDQGALHPLDFQPLAFDSRDLWGRLSLRPGFEFDFRVNGLINLKPERFPDAAAADRAARESLSMGYSVTTVDREQLAVMEPGVKPTADAGLHHPSDAHVNPLKAALSFVRALIAAGGRFTRNARVTNVSVHGDRLMDVQLGEVSISPKSVVFACGSHALPIPGTASRIPVRAKSGQIVATRPLPKLMKYTVVGEHLVTQLKCGRILTGGNVVDGIVETPDFEVATRMANAAANLVSGLEPSDFTHTWCGARPATPDGLPIIDLIPGCKNGWIATGHYRNGVLLSPITGLHVADWIRSGKRPADLDPCRLDRFGPAS